MHTHIDAKHMKLKALRKRAGENCINTIEQEISNLAEKGHFTAKINDENRTIKILKYIDISSAKDYFRLKGYLCVFSDEFQILYISWA